MKNAKITIFAGHFGSGKTNLAVNYSFWLKKHSEEVILCDLDIVNPYFRTVDAKEALERQGIELISSRFANSNVDAPALPAEVQQIFDRPNATSVIDLGGDDRGALALGRYAKRLRGENHEMLLVVNPYRPLTGTEADLEEIVREIETAARVPFTGIVNNANLGAETTLEDVEKSLVFVQKASQQLGLPIKMTAVNRRLLTAAGKPPKALLQSGEVFPMDIMEKAKWKL